MARDCWLSPRARRTSWAFPELTFGMAAPRRRMSPRGAPLRLMNASGWYARPRARNGSPLELNALVQRVIVTKDRHAAAAKLARHWPVLSAEEILQSPYLLVGTVEQMVEDLEARRQRWGMSYYAVHEPYLDDFAPVVARLAGK